MEARVAGAVSLASLFLLTATGSAAVTYPGKFTEQLVEAHTTYVVMGYNVCLFHHTSTYRDGNCPNAQASASGRSHDVDVEVRIQRLGAAVAVLVRDRVRPPPPPAACDANRDLVATIFHENPGVLWFNDQFLVGDDLDLVEAEVDANADVCRRRVAARSEAPWRYPCGGWILATQAGNPDPRPYLGMLAYQESYHIVDPNDYVWIVDKWGVPSYALGSPPTFNRAWDFNQDTDNGPNTTEDYDDRYANGTVRDGDLRLRVAYADEAAAPWHFWLSGVNVWSVAVLGMPYEEEAAGDGCDPYRDAAGNATRLYNGLLFFFFDDLARSPAAPKMHGEGALHDGDTDGCQVDTEWACPADDDDAEGNSHPFNANATDSGPDHLHPTARVDLYVSALPPPDVDVRRWAVYDAQGSSAPWHVHGNESFDDRVGNHGACLDEDSHTYRWTYTYNGSNQTSSTYTETHRETRRYGDGESPTNGADTSDCT